jgi:hypothetical protein
MFSVMALQASLTKERAQHRAAVQALTALQQAITERVEEY